MNSLLDDFFVEPKNRSLLGELSMLLLFYLKLIIYIHILVAPFCLVSEWLPPNWSIAVCVVWGLIIGYKVIRFLFDKDVTARIFLIATILALQVFSYVLFFYQSEPFWANYFQTPFSDWLAWSWAVVLFFLPSLLFLNIFSTIALIQNRKKHSSQ